MPKFNENELPSSMQVWQHKRKKTDYTVMRLCRLRNYGYRKHTDGSSGKWTIGVVYTENNPVDWYTREYLDFMENFERQS